MADGDEGRWQRERRDRILIAEYQKTQDSAEHHDNLLWIVVALILSGMAAIVTLALKHPSEYVPAADFIFPSLGIILSTLLCFCVYSFGLIRNQKYGRCKAIESELGMAQHRGTGATHQRAVVFILSMGSLIGFLVWLSLEIHRHIQHWISGCLIIGICLVACIWWGQRVLAALEDYLRLAIPS
jgi:hypothetical protein